MNKLINITNKGGNLLVSSREVAENFEKRHVDVVNAIENKIKSLEGTNFSTDLFHQTDYMHSQNMQVYKEYLLTRDGFSFLVMGFTGQKADIWKLKYIEAFNRMEKSLQENMNLGNLSPQLQLLISMELKQSELETAVTETKKEVQAIRDVITINPKAEWRKETNDILVKIGKNVDDYSKPRNEVYEALQHRASCRPNVLINNLKKRALENGMAPSKVNKLNILDVLENNPRLKEIYIAIVKDMAVKHNIV